MDNYALREVNTRAEMDAAVDVLWISHHEPYRPAFYAFFPVFGARAEDREAGISASKDRIWEAHRTNPASHWFYVEEVQTGKVVGSTEWQLNEHNPFSNGVPDLTASWWPEGQGREFCTAMIRQAYAPRHNWLRRPHVVLNLMSVLPTHRRHGVGTLLLQWGLERADALGLESWLEASEGGRLLYEKLGFRLLIKTSADATKANPSDEWKRLQHDLLPLEIWVMWRPPYGKWEDGATALPWHLPNP